VADRGESKWTPKSRLGRKRTKMQTVSDEIGHSEDRSFPARICCARSDSAHASKIRLGRMLAKNGRIASIIISRIDSLFVSYAGVLPFRSRFLGLAPYFSNSFTISLCS
jgi:hypothetical protein